MRKKTSNAEFYENPYHDNIPRTENVKGKLGKVHPGTDHEGQEGEWR
jgi:hypothetical protein